MEKNPTRISIIFFHGLGTIYYQFSLFWEKTVRKINWNHSAEKKNIEPTPV
jgi:hypothetical protein